MEHVTSLTSGLYLPSLSNSGVAGNNTLVVTKSNILLSNGAYNTASDERLKDDIMDITNAGVLVNQIGAKCFTMKAASKKRKHFGVIAQQVREVVPEAVTEGNDGFL